MRILRVAQKVYPDVTGGGPYHVHALSRDQADRGHDVTVATVATDGSRPSSERRDGYEVRRFSPTASLLGNDVSLGLARYLASASGFDVVHAHSHLYFATNVAAVRRRLGSTPLAVTNHGLYSQTAPRWVFDGYLRTLGRWTFNRADVVFCYTDEDERRLREIGVEAPVSVVANGIDETRFTPDGPRSDRIAPEDFVVLFVGRLVEGKRPRDAIDAVARLGRDVPDASLVLVGDGPLRGDLERYARERGVPDRVQFLGAVPYEDMPSVYRSADVLLLPSEAEGLPRTVLEGFASEVPAVTSDLDQLVPVVEQAGETVPVGAVPEFAAALRSLADDDARRPSLGAAGRRLVHEQFTWEQTVEETTARLEALGEW